MAVRNGNRPRFQTVHKSAGGCVYSLIKEVEAPNGHKVLLYQNQARGPAHGVLLLTHTSATHAVNIVHKEGNAYTNTPYKTKFIDVVENKVVATLEHMTSVTVHHAKRDANLTEKWEYQFFNENYLSGTTAMSSNVMRRDLSKFAS